MKKKPKELQLKSEISLLAFSYAFIRNGHSASRTIPHPLFLQLRLSCSEPSLSNELMQQRRRRANVLWRNYEEKFKKKMPHFRG